MIRFIMYISYLFTLPYAMYLLLLPFLLVFLLLVCGAESAAMAWKKSNMPPLFVVPLYQVSHINTLSKAIPNTLEEVHSLQ